jgi:hypothetical protein
MALARVVAGAAREATCTLMSLRFSWLLSEGPSSCTKPWQINELGYANLAARVLSQWGIVSSRGMSPRREAGLPTRWN